jgi:hypothetical protein
MPLKRIFFFAINAQSSVVSVTLAYFFYDETKQAGSVRRRLETHTTPIPMTNSGVLVFSLLVQRVEVNTSVRYNSRVKLIIQKAISNVPVCHI